MVTNRRCHLNHGVASLFLDLLHEHAGLLAEVLIDRKHLLHLLPDGGLGVSIGGGLLKVSQRFCRGRPGELRLERVVELDDPAA